MSLVVHASDEESGYALALEKWAELLRQVLLAEGIAADAEASLSFVGKERIATLNEAYLGEEGPTDVVAFPIDLAGPDSADLRHRTGPDGPPLLVGDIFVCPAVAEENAKGAGRTLDEEIATLVVHGALHLLGYDHEEEAEAEAMWARQAELLRQLWGPDDQDGT